MPATPAHPTVPVRKAALARWLGVDPSAVGTGPRHPLAGGVRSPLVERVEVTAVGTAGVPYRCAVVAKRACAAEVVVLREIATVSTDAFPELIDAGADDHGPWVVLSFRPGAALAWDAALPAAVYASLARLHQRYLGGAGRLPAGLPRVDEEFCRHALREFAPAGIHEARRGDPRPVHDRALDLLGRWSHDERMLAGPRVLPATLLHGDVYGHNVVVDSADGTRPCLIDWGSARIGPAMLDVALTAGTSSAGFAAYLRAWEEAACAPLDRWQAAAGHAWATAFGTAMFVGAVATRFGPAPVGRLLDRAGAALDRFGHLLAGAGHG